MLTITNVKQEKFKHIIFDFDGVIADTDTARFKILAEILSKYNIDLQTDFNKSDIVGNPTDIFLHNNYPLLNKDKIKNIVEKRRTEYLSNLEKHCIVYPKAVQTINDLRADGHSIHLATTNESFVAQKLITYIGIRDAFNTCFLETILLIKLPNKKIIVFF